MRDSSSPFGSFDQPAQTFVPSEEYKPAPSTSWTRQPANKLFFGIVAALGSAGLLYQFIWLISANLLLPAMMEKFCPTRSRDMHGERLPTASCADDAASAIEPYQLSAVLIALAIVVAACRYIWDEYGHHVGLQTSTRMKIRVGSNILVSLCLFFGALGVIQLFPAYLQAAFTLFSRF